MKAAKVLRSVNDFDELGDGGNQLPISSLTVNNRLIFVLYLSCICLVFFLYLSCICLWERFVDDLTQAAAKLGKVGGSWSLIRSPFGVFRLR